MNKQKLERRLERKIKNLQAWFEPYAEEWKNQTDDRGLFSEMYYEMIQALEQLKQLDECSEYLFFEVILHKINEDKRTLNEIKGYFYMKEIIQMRNRIPHHQNKYIGGIKNETRYYYRHSQQKQVRFLQVHLEVFRS